MSICYTAIKQKLNIQKEVFKMRVDRYKLSLELMKRDITQKQLAEMCGLSRATINGVSCGRSCSGKTIMKIARALDMEPDEILEH